MRCRYEGTVRWTATGSGLTKWSEGRGEGEGCGEGVEVECGYGRVRVRVRFGRLLFWMGEGTDGGVLGVGLMMCFFCSDDVMRILLLLLMCVRYVRCEIYRASNVTRSWI